MTRSKSTMLSVLTLLLLTVSTLGLVPSDDYEYENIDEAKIRGLGSPGGGARLVNALAAAPDNLEFVAAFYLSSSPALRLPTCSAALITPRVALRCLSC